MPLFQRVVGLLLLPISTPRRFKVRPDEPTPAVHVPFYVHGHKTIIFRERASSPAPPYSIWAELSDVSASLPDVSASLPDVSVSLPSSPSSNQSTICIAVSAISSASSPTSAIGSGRGVRRGSTAIGGVVVSAVTTTIARTKRMSRIAARFLSMLQ